MSVQLKSQYVITAMKGNTRVYCGIDSHSGGYPYWSAYLPQAELMDEIDMARIMSNVSLLRGRDITEIGLAEIQTTLKITPISTIEMEAKEVQAEIAELEQRLQEKRQKLNNLGK